MSHGIVRQGSQLLSSPHLTLGLTPDIHFTDGRTDKGHRFYFDTSPCFVAYIIDKH